MVVGWFWLCNVWFSVYINKILLDFAYIDHKSWHRWHGRTSVNLTTPRWNPVSQAWAADTGMAHYCTWEHASTLDADACHFEPIHYNSWHFDRSQSSPVAAIRRFKTDTDAIQENIRSGKWWPLVTTGGQLLPVVATGCQSWAVAAIRHFNYMYRYQTREYKQWPMVASVGQWRSVVATGSQSWAMAAIIHYNYLYTYPTREYKQWPMMANSGQWWPLVASGGQWQPVVAAGSQSWPVAAFTHFNYMQRYPTRKYMP